MEPATYKEVSQIGKLIDAANKIVVIQADNPDADSLASSLALEEILGSAGKEVVLFCGVDLPSYLSFLPGWDRVTTELPSSFDLSIIVDTASVTLLEQLERRGFKAWVTSRPCIVIDHHASDATIDFATVMLNTDAVATGEVLYELGNQLEWDMSVLARSLLTSAILSDSLGLMSSNTSARTIQIIAEAVEAGVDLPQLEAARRETQRREPELIHYKGKLLQRVEFYADNKIAMLTIPWEEIEKYSPLYNPPMLVMDDMRLAIGTHIAICFKLYTDGKVTAKIRCNHGHGIADKLAEHFGGGGHPYAAGYKVQNSRSYEELKNETIAIATKLLEEQ